MSEADREILKKLADDLLYGPRMAGHAQFRHFALLKVTEAFEAGVKSCSTKHSENTASVQNAST